MEKARRRRSSMASRCSAKLRLTHGFGSAAIQESLWRRKAKLHRPRKACTEWPRPLPPASKKSPQLAADQKSRSIDARIFSSIRFPSGNIPIFSVVIRGEVASMGGSGSVVSNPLERNSDARPGEWVLLSGLSFVVFAAHMLVSGRYGYFVDELYYLACSHHLAWGYVDQPPLIAMITWLERATLGDSLSALRFLPAVAAGLRVLLTGLIARELGARRFGMALACVCVMVAPIYLGLDSLLTMNVFESLFWMGAALVTLKIFNGASLNEEEKSAGLKTRHSTRQRLWILFGVVCGVGLLNKHSMLFFGFGLFVGLLLTRQRRQFASPW